MWHLSEGDEMSVCVCAVMYIVQIEREYSKELIHLPFGSLFFYVYVIFLFLLEGSRAIILF